ncbi:MAG: 50S ribosomal protein L25 [Chloroflexota bacterium]
MEKLVIKASKRTLTGKQVSQLRRAGQLPGVIYGHNFDPTPITMEAHSAGLLIPHLTSSSIVNIDLDGKIIPALVREKQKNYIKHVFTHIDFQAISLTEKIRADVTIHFHGTSSAIKNYNAAIVNNLESIEVEALPNDLPERIDVDLTVLVKIGDAIHVRDLVIPTGVTLLTDKDVMVAVATATHDEAADALGGAEVAEPEVIEKGKKEEEDSK